LLENIHRRVIAEARSRRLNYRQMALEFNQRNIRRRGGQTWTATALRQRWANLNGLQRRKAKTNLTAVQSQCHRGTEPT